MKKLFIPIIAGAICCCAYININAQEYKTHINKEFTVSSNGANMLSVYNLEGFIKIEGYSGNKVMIEIDETISAKTNELVEEGKKEFKLAFDQNGDSMIAYIAEPYDSRPRHHWNYD